MGKNSSYGETNFSTLLCLGASARNTQNINIHARQIVRETGDLKNSQRQKLFNLLFVPLNLIRTITTTIII